jgi:hypothetical protein
VLISVRYRCSGSNLTSAFSEGLAALFFGVSALALFEVLRADIFLALTDLEVLDLTVLAAILAGRLAVVADFFATVLVFPVVFLAVRLALLTVFLTGELEVLVRFWALFFAAVAVFAVANFVLRIVFGAERFTFLAAVLTADVDRLTVLLV